jgi:pimeloyl-ACP methyl ester carboxylesterase
MAKLRLPQQLEAEYPFQSKYFDVGNAKLHYLDEGKGHPIIMVHGNPTWSFFYRKLITNLKNRYRVIVPDHLGMGLSDKPQDYDYCLKNHIANLVALLEHLEIKNASFIVHDWGGPIGLGSIIQKQLKIEKLIILNTAAFADTLIPVSINLCRTPYAGEYLMRQFNGFAWPATFMAPSKPLSKNSKIGFLYPYNNYQTRVGIARFVQDIPMNKKHRSFELLKNIEENLPNISGDKFILWGKKDFCFNQHFFERWKNIYPEAKYDLLEDAGHYLIEDQPELVLQKVKEFLACLNGI